MKIVISAFLLIVCLIVLNAIYKDEKRIGNGYKIYYFYEGDIYFVKKKGFNKSSGNVFDGIVTDVVELDRCYIFYVKKHYGGDVSGWYFLDPFADKIKYIGQSIDNIKSEFRLDSVSVINIKSFFNSL